MSNAIRCINQKFAFKNSRTSCLGLALIFNLDNQGTTVLYPKNWLQVAKYDESYTVFLKLVIWTYGLVVKVSCSECGNSGSIPDECWNSAPQPFCVALSPSVHWHSRFLYCCAIYDLYFLRFRQWRRLWRSRADRGENLNTTIWLPLFWRTWTRAWASTCPHVWAWHMGRDYSYRRA